MTSALPGEREVARTLEEAATAGKHPEDTYGWRPVWTLLVRLSQYRARLVLTAVVALVAQCCMAGTTIAAAWLVGKAILGHPLDSLTTGFVVLALCATGQGAFAWLRDFVAHDYAFRMITELRLWLFGGMKALAPGYLLRRRTGDLAATLIGDLERMEWLYAHILPNVVSATLVPVVALTVLTTISPPLGLTIAVLTVLIATVPAWLTHRAYVQGKALRNELGTVHAEVVDGVQGLRELVSFGHGSYYLRFLASRMRTLMTAHLAYGRRAGIEGAASDLLLSIATAVAILGTASLVANGDLGREYFAVVVLLVGAALTPVVALVGSLSALGEVRGCAARVMAVVDAEPLVSERPAAVAIPAAEVQPLMRFDEVTFRYDEQLPRVLRAVSFDVAAGETVALVGRSGAGKSTCVNLLMRFWDVESGRVVVGEHDVRDLTLDSLRSAIALVPQDVYLFHATIRENLRLARPDASDEQVRWAAMQARAWEFIEALPDGVDTVISERGLSLSGGQRQRIAIARAFLQDSPLLLLDEAVSNVDAENEVLVHEALSELRRGRATLVVAHRLSTIREADRIVLLDGGEVAEIGTHADLLAAGGKYAQLIAGQHRGILE